MTKEELAHNDEIKVRIDDLAKLPCNTFIDIRDNYYKEVFEALREKYIDYISEQDPFRWSFSFLEWLELEYGLRYENAKDPERATYTSREFRRVLSSYEEQNFN